jgi:23S rRNA maturation-related 3'-5' exoribonuclease YhaM
MNPKILEPAIKQIYSETIRSFVITCLQDVPDYIAEIPASSTGKYHHKTSLGKGGLINHIFRACHFGKYFLDAYGIKPEDIKGDIVFAALILHDIGKKENYDKDYKSYINHPITAVEMISKHKHMLPESVFTIIKNAILWHMGPWSPESVKKEIGQYTQIELIVFNSDYLSSKKEIDLQPFS